MSWIDQVYKRAPVFIQNELFSLYGIYWKWLRFGGDFPKYVKLYENRSFYTRLQWEGYQSEQLKQLLTVASEHVPYYRTTWNEEQKRAARRGDLSSLPLLEKLQPRSNPYQFVRDDIRPLHQKHFWTSGSTGTPVKTIWTIAEVQNSLAVREVRSATWAGVSFKLPRATFSGRIIEPNPYSKGPFYRYNAAEKQVYFSAFHLSPDTAQFYVNALRRHNIQWLTGYTVSFYLLAKYVLEKSIPVPPIIAIVTTSEKLTSSMREVMEKAFNCRVYEEYSSIENVMFASECECGRLHVSPDVGILEILRPDGSNCAPGEVGEVVATSLIRQYQPFIRYRLGDLAAWDPEPCPCKRSLPVLKEVVGRIEEALTCPDGRRIAQFYGIFTDQPNVLEGQVVQLALDKVLVKVVTTKDFSQLDKEEVVKRVQQRMGSAVNVNVVPVDIIPRTKSGKFQASVSLMSHFDEQ